MILCFRGGNAIYYIANPIIAGLEGTGVIRGRAVRFKNRFVI
jgi:hypothetical protein